MTKPTAPNTKLAGLMRESGMSNKGLARRVTELAAQHREIVRVDHNDVRKWLTGMVPRDPKPRLVAQALSIQLGRSVSAADAGFHAAGVASDGQALQAASSYSERPIDAINVLYDLAERDRSNNSALLASTVTSNAAAEITASYLYSKPRNLEDDEFVVVSPSALADQIRQTTENFMGLDFSFGGGHTRRMLIEFYQSTVRDTLLNKAAGSHRNDVFSAAAEVVQLIGWSAYDAGRHRAAASYFTQGLTLASEAGDSLMGGRMLASLSHQANFLGNYRDAVIYARAAQGSAPRGANRVNAMFFAMEARALASLKDAKNAVIALERAELLFGRDSQQNPDWISYFDEFELHGEASHVYRDLSMNNQAHTATLGAIDPIKTPPRTRAFIQLVSAASTAQDGNLEEAVRLAREAMDLSEGLQSDRYVRYLTNFRTLLLQMKCPPSIRLDLDSALLDRHPQVELL